MKVLSDIVADLRKKDSAFAEDVNILAVGRLAPDEMNGGHKGSMGSVDESLILAFEASFAFLQTIHRVFTLLSAPSSLLPATGTNSRAEFLSGSTNPLDTTVPTVHARLVDLLASLFLAAWKHSQFTFLQCCFVQESFVRRHTFGEVQ